MLHGPLVEPVLRIRESACRPAITRGLSERKFWLVAADVEMNIGGGLVVRAVVEVDDLGFDRLNIEAEADTLAHVPSEVEREVFGSIGLRRVPRVGTQAGTARVRAWFVGGAAPAVADPVGAV